MNIQATRCSDCADLTYHIPLDPDTMSFFPEFGFCLHLNEDELTDFYLQLKEIKMGLVDVEVSNV